MADLVRYELKDGVAVVTIDNPPVNALAPEVWTQIEDAVKRANANTSYWNAVTNNCNHYVGQLAEAVGLRVPGAFHMSMGFIPDLQEMNEAGAPPMAAPTRPAKLPKKKSAIAATLTTETNALGR